MKNRRLILISCCAAAALIASPAFGEKHKKSMGMSASKPQRMTAQTTQVSPRAGHATRQITPTYNRNARMQFSGTQQYVGTRYGGSRYAGTRYYGNNGYYNGTGYYYGGGYGYPSYGYSYWPYVAASVAPSLWAPGYYGSGYYGYPYSYNGGYPYNYSYYGSGYGYAGSTVAAVQQRLGQLGYYHGVIDGAIGPQTRSAIAAFESRHGLIVDGRISQPLLGRLGLG